jgi:hypothetical protein
VVVGINGSCGLLGTDDEPDDDDDDIRPDGTKSVLGTFNGASQSTIFG